jgi:hypothetical protein
MLAATCTSAVLFGLGGFIVGAIFTLAFCHVVSGGDR